MSRSLTTHRAALSLLVAMLAAAPALAGFAGTDVFLPMVGRQVGVHPSNWYTTVWLYNPAADAATARLYLLERGTSNLSPPWVDVMVAPGDTEKLENVVETYFHAEVFGAVRVTCPTKLVVTSRVYSKAPGTGEKDSVGQDFAAVPASFAIGVGERSQILGASQTLPSADSEYRYNFGLVETTGHLANARVTAYDKNGAFQGSTDVTVRAWSQGQWAFKDRFPAVSSENSRLEVEVTSGTGKVIAYGSGVANGSQDPTTFEMTYPDSLLGIGSVQHDTTLTGDGTAGAPLGIAASATAGQVLTTVAGGDATPGEGMAAVAGNAVAWQSPGSLSLGLTPGGVTFGNASGGLGQDAPALFWSSANKRLGIGLDDPRFRLDVNGNIRISTTSADAGTIVIGDYAFLHGYGIYNTFVGPGAGNFTMTGRENTGVGAGALLHMTAGSYNTAVGSSTLWANTTGGSNTAAGAFALEQTTSGAENTAVGARALRLNTTASSNSAFGAAALSATSTGGGNTALGSQSMSANTTGYANTAVGALALQANTTGFSNVAVGQGSLYASTTAEGNTATGASSLAANTTGARNSAFGYATLNYNTTGWANTAVGSQALYRNTTAVGNTAIGYTSLYANTTGTRNVGLGDATLFSNTTGGSNTALGGSSMYGNTEGTSNSAVGTDSLRSNTTGSFNTAAGVSSLYNNTTGANSTAIGYQALAANVTGTGNTAVGSGSLQANVSSSGNTALGRMALATVNGGGNTAVGDNALVSSTVGATNTAVGNAAGYSALGSGDVFLGYQAGFFEVGSNRLHIANSSSSTLIYGQFDSKRVAIAATNPTNTLDVNGSLRVRGLAGADVRPVAVDANGVLVIELPSDERLKRDIVPLAESIDVLAALAGLHGVSYSWDTTQERVSGFGNRREVGLLAQDVEKVLPQVVSTDADGYRSVDYARLTALLVEIARAQQREIEELKAAVADLHR